VPDTLLACPYLYDTSKRQKYQPNSGLSTTSFKIVAVETIQFDWSNGIQENRHYFEFFYGFSLSYIQMPTSHANAYYEIEYLVTLFGLLWSLGNCTWATARALKKPEYNTFIAISMGLHALAFLPLLRSTGLSINDLHTGHDIELRLKETQFMGFLHNVLFSFASVTYILTIQWRMTAVRVLTSYSQIWDTIFTGLTISVWSVTCLLNLMVLPYFTGSSGILYGSIWSAYVLLMDTAVSITFLRVLFRNNSLHNFKQTAKQRKLVHILISTLIMTTVLNWSLLAFPVMSATAFANIPDKRRMAYRFGFCFSSMVNTGTLVFILSVRAIFAEDESKKSELSGTCLKEIKSGHADYVAYNPRQTK
jgi:hypothetical protein